NGLSNITVPTNRLGMDPGTTVAAAAGIPWNGPPPIFPGDPGSPALGVWTIQDLLGGVGSGQSGDDLLLNNVISFDVKVLQEGYPNSGGLQFFVDLPQAAQGNNLTFQNYITPNTPYGVSVFDTWTKQGTYGNLNATGQVNWAAANQVTSM